MIKVINSGKTTNIDGSNGSAIKVGNTTISDVIVNGKLVYHPDKIHISYSFGILGVQSKVHIYNDTAFPFGTYCTCEIKAKNGISGSPIIDISKKTEKGEKIDIKGSNPYYVIVLAPAWFDVNISIKPFINDAQTEYGTEYKYSKLDNNVWDRGDPVEEYYL